MNGNVKELYAFHYFCSSFCFERLCRIDWFEQRAKRTATYLSPFKLVGEKDTMLLKMSETGHISQQMQEIGRIDMLGSVHDASGKLIARLRNDDFLENADGKPLVKVGMDGTLDNDSGMPIYWSEDGTLVRGKETLGIRMLPRELAGTPCSFNSSVPLPGI